MTIQSISSNFVLTTFMSSDMMNQSFYYLFVYLFSALLALWTVGVFLAPHTYRFSHICLVFPKNRFKTCSKKVLRCSQGIMHSKHTTLYDCMYHQQVHTQLWVKSMTGKTYNYEQPAPKNAQKTFRNIQNTDNQTVTDL